jgi:WD40 repeat protein
MQTKRLAMLSSTQDTDQPIERIQNGLDSVIQAVCRLREENDNLERLRSLATIHVRQYESDIERLRCIYKTMKASLDLLSPTVPPLSMRGDSQNEKGTCLAHASVPWDVRSTEPFFTRSHVRLRYALRMESILCTIHFNHDGSIFSFTDGLAVFFIMANDGSLVGSCPLPKSRAPTDSHARAICFSRDSRWLAVSGPVHSVTMIDVQSRKFFKSLDAHASHVSTIAFFNDSERMVTGGFDGKLVVWNTRDFQVVKSIQHGVENGQIGKEEMIVAIAIASDDEYLAVGFMNGVVGIYDADFSQPMTSFAAHNEYMLNVALSRNDVIATASRDKSAKLWTIRGVASCKQTLTGHTDYVLTVAFSPIDPVVFTGSKDETVRCWNVTTGQQLFTLKGHGNTLFQIDHHPSKRTIVSCSGEGLICVWDYELP